MATSKDESIETPKDPRDPDDTLESDRLQQHPADHSFLLQSMSELREGFGELRATVENLRGKPDDLKKEIREDISQLREDRRNDSTRIETALEGIRNSLDRKLDSISFRIGVLAFVAILGLLAFMPEIWEWISNFRQITPPPPKG